MSRKRPARSGNPDLRRGMQVPGPPIAEIEAKLLYWLTPMGSAVSLQLIWHIRLEDKRTLWFLDLENFLFLSFPHAIL
jgi:hypothetical protein